MTLYEIAGELIELLELAELEEIDAQTFADTFEGLAGEFEDKADSYVKVMQELQADSDALAEQIKRMTTRKKTIDANKERMSAALKTAMEATGKTKFKTALFSYSISGNGGKRPVIVDADTDELPDNLCKIERKPDKTEIEKFLQENEDSEMPIKWAHFGERGTHLTIK